MACKNHPDRESVAACVECGAEVCEECEKVGPEGKSHCPDHAPSVAEEPVAEASEAPPAAAPETPPIATPQAASPPPAAASSPPPPATGSSEGSNRVLAALGYPIWIIALVIILTDMKRDAFMRYNGWNALFWGIAYAVVMIALGIVSGILGNVPGLGALVGALWGLVPLAFLVFSIIFAVKAYNGQDVNIPVVSDMARKQADSQRV